MGKPDRKTLQGENAAIADTAPRSLRPRTPAEQALAQMPGVQGLGDGPHGALVVFVRSPAEGDQLPKRVDGRTVETVVVGEVSTS